ncbi:MAG: TlyA family rRNA (cytidine-2'-O)-methyltransferase [Syntrophus sp. (in: bacteria)]|nr:TlyA family rRNA (cytidine-2'-O)-methyltransferase [Syntrophus sp. (in: bacteria)]
MVKERIDVVLTKRGLAPSREKARVLVMAGEVYVERERITKPDQKFTDDVCIEIKGNPIPYVSYGGVKLEAALKTFSIDVEGMKALDVGSSTGGFVDCLLKNGASIVYAFDAGTHQLHESLRKDPRVILKENFNARHLTYEDIGGLVDIATIDVSFISLKKILPPVIPLLKPDGHILSLVKPQFEVGRFEVGKGGIVRDTEKIQRVIEEIKAYGHSIGIKAVNILEVPREKEKKNKEYFILWEIRTYQNL